MVGAGKMIAFSITCVKAIREPLEGKSPYSIYLNYVAVVSKSRLTLCNPTDGSTLACPEISQSLLKFMSTESVTPSSYRPVNSHINRQEPTREPHAPSGPANQQSPPSLRPDHSQPPDARCPSAPRPALRPVKTQRVVPILCPVRVPL